ncbi:MAG: hypothetical protein WBM52_03125 [Thiogranum sp.]
MGEGRAVQEQVPRDVAVERTRIIHKVNRRQAREGALGCKVNRRQARQGELRSKTR